MTMQQTIPTELVALEPDRNELVNMALATTVTDETTREAATGVLARVRIILKKAEETRTSLVKPLNEHVKFLNGMVANFTDPLKKADSHLNSTIGGYLREMEEVRRKEQERQNKLAENRAAKAEAKGITSPIPETVAPLVQGVARTIETDGAKVTYIDHWSFVITDPNLIPRDFMIPNEPMLNMMARATKDKTNIPGGHAVNNPTASIRTV